MDSQKDLLSTQLNAENSPNKDSVSTNVHEPLEGTPFWIRKMDNKWFATLGRHYITGKHDTKEEVEELIKSKDWDIIGTFVAVLVERFTALERENKLEEKLEEKLNKEAEFDN